LPVERIGTFARNRGHAKVDLIKLDIEGGEYAVIADLVRAGPLPRQLLVEFHHNMYDIELDQTAAALALLRQTGYLIFDVSPTGREYSFIRMDSAQERVLP